MSTLTNTFRGKNLSAIDCSAVIVAHGRFPEYNAANLANFAFQVPPGVNVFFYATPGQLLHDASWVAGGSLCFLPENTLASAICRSVYENENDLRYSLTYSEGDLVPDLDIITDGYQEGDPHYDKFVSGIKVCSRPFTIPFGHFSSYGLTPSGKVQSGRLRGHNVYKLSAIIQFCKNYRTGLFPLCTDNDINIHVATCMENFPGQDSVKLYAQRVIQYTTAKTGSPPGYTDNELVNYLRSRGTDIVNQTDPDIREKERYNTVKRAQEYDKYILDIYKEENNDFMKKARKEYNTRLIQDTVKDPFSTPPKTIQSKPSKQSKQTKQTKQAGLSSLNRGFVLVRKTLMADETKEHEDDDDDEDDDYDDDEDDDDTDMDVDVDVDEEGNIMKIQKTYNIKGALKSQLDALSMECFQQPYIPIPYDDKEMRNEILYAIVDNSGNISSFLSVYVEDVQNGYYSIWNVCTGSQFRQQGLMKRLLSRVMEDLVYMGAVKIKLTVLHTNPPRDRLMNMYRAHGFQVSNWDARNMIMTWWKG